MNTPSLPSIPSSPADRAALAAQLAQELGSLRDALVTLSLSLKDWQFEVDEGARLAAQQQVEQTLAACHSSAAACIKPSKP